MMCGRRPFNVSISSGSICEGSSVSFLLRVDMGIKMEVERKRWGGGRVVVLFVRCASS